MRIFFQNPTKGPLLTVSFDNDDGSLLAFVPVAADCGAKTATASAVGVTAGASLTGIMAIATLFPGDSSPKPPLQGINRFAPRASIDAIEDGRTIERAMQSADAVGLPGEGTPTTATDVSPLAGLAAKLKAWDGISPLEVAGFKFEKVADADGKPTIKITIGTDNVQDIIDVARVIQEVFPEETHHLTVDITHPNLGRALLKWGHRFFDGIIAEIVATRPQILAMNEKLERGEVLSEDERILVATLFTHLTDCLNAFNLSKDILDNFLVGSQDWVGFLHDMGKRGQGLNIILDICEMISNREPIDDELTGYFNIAGQIYIFHALDYALALAKPDIKNNRIWPAQHFNGGETIPLANEEQFDTLVDILANLISNAARYSDPQKNKREIHITVRRTADGIEIEVRDNGIGIPADKLKDIGQFGFRVGEKDVDGSHGHGLWQTQRNLEDLGWGKLQVESTHGDGSSFRFTIPIHVN